MDPAAAAQPSTNKTILPGQFVQIGEEPQVVPNPLDNTAGAPSAQLKMPESAAPEGITSGQSAKPFPPPPSPLPALHLASQTSESVPTEPQPAILPPLGQDLPTGQAPLPTNEQPDPTPFVAPGHANALETHLQPPEQSKSSKGKVLFFSLGAIALIGIISGLAYFFVFNKNLPLGAKIEDTIKSQLEDLPPLPKRVKGGFADLPPIQAFFAQAASPGATPNRIIPAY